MKLEGIDLSLENSSCESQTGNWMTHSEGGALWPLYQVELKGKDLESCGKEQGLPKT